MKQNNLEKIKIKDTIEQQLKFTVKWMGGHSNQFFRINVEIKFVFFLKILIFYVISHWFCRLVFIILFVAFATATAATTTAAAVVTTATATGRVSDCLDEVSQRDLAGLVR